MGSGAFDLVWTTAILSFLFCCYTPPPTNSYQIFDFDILLNYLI